MAPRAAQRQYASMIAESPVRHAIFNKPFSSLRRRTENLLDNITGGSNQFELEKEQRIENERKRELTCRFCRLVFANDQGLSKHYDLFPKHLREERVKPNAGIQASDPSRPPLPPLSRHETVPIAGMHSHSNSTSILPPSRSSTSTNLDRQASLQRSKARSQPDMHKDFVPSSRPLPTTAMTAVDDQDSPQLANFNGSAPIYNGHQTSMPVSQPSPFPTQSASANNFNPRFASDFYLPSETWTSFHPSNLDINPSSSPYGFANSMAFASRPQNPNGNQAQPSNTVPHATAMLPTFDFESQFTRIPREGIPEPSKARQVDLGSNQNDPIGDRNRQAGARSAARVAVKYDALFDTPSSPVQRDQRHMPHRGASESAVQSAQQPKESPQQLPNTFGGVVRAIVATGTSGPNSPSAISPGGQRMGKSDHKRVNTWVPLAGDEDERIESRSRSASGSGLQWGALMDSLPGSPAHEKKQQTSAFKEVEPVKTGLTSFSNVEVESPTDSGTQSPNTTRPRRNTNPFLNRDFLKGIPNALKTPPLSPSSPWGAGSASPGNPFKQLADDADDEVEFFDAPHGPKTPLDEFNRSRAAPTKNLDAPSMALPEPVRTMPGAL